MVNLEGESESRRYPLVRLANAPAEEHHGEADDSPAHSSAQPAWERNTCLIKGIPRHSKNILLKSSEKTLLRSREY